MAVLVAEHSSISNSDGAPATEIGHTTEVSHTLGAIDTDPRAKGAVYVAPDHVPHRDRTRVPWGFIFSLLILAGFELWLHLSHWPKKIPYRLDLDEYYAVAATLDRHDPADITIIGSSRARESIDVPVVRSILRRETGQHLSVANYGVGGGRAYVFESITRQILRAKHPPRVIILGTAERDFGNAGDIYDQAPIYWNLDDWKAEYNRRGVKVLDDLPTVIRTYLGKIYLTLGYREQLNLRIRQILAGEHDTLSQLDGELTPWQPQSDSFARHTTRQTRCDASLCEDLIARCLSESRIGQCDGSPRSRPAAAGMFT